MAKVYDPIMCMMVDKPDKVQDGILFYQLRFSSGRTEGAKLDESEIRSYAEALLEKYGEKQVAVSRQGKIVATYLNAKARDVASATQRYINTIVGESKANAEKLVRQAEQDDEVSDNELKYVYKVYNDKFGYKFHDSASALDEAIRTADSATGDKLYADVKAIYNLFSNILLTYTNEQSVQKLANEGTKKCLELAAKVKGVRDEAIKTSDASTGHKVVVFVENYLRSIGKNNSTGKYDRIVQGVRSLLSQSLLDDEGLKKAAEHEADRLLKKYNL